LDYDNVIEMILVKRRKRERERERKREREREKEEREVITLLDQQGWLQSHSKYLIRRNSSSYSDEPQLDQDLI